MSRIERFAVLMFALVGIALFLRGVRAVQKGEVKAKYRTYVRDESPTMFWITVCSEFAIALVVMPMVIRHFLSSGSHP